VSYDRVISTLRDELVRGGARRRRRERRRTVALACVPFVAALAIGGSVWRSEDSSDVDVAGGPATPSVIAACDALIDARQASNFGDDQTADFERFARFAVESGDAVLAPLGQAIIDTSAVMGSSQAVIDALNGGIPRCRELGAPDYVHTYVAASLGPVPNVALESYGQVVTFEPLDTDVPPTLDRQVVGHDLSAVEVARVGDQTFVARWSYAWRDGTRRYCWALGSINGGSAGCGELDPDPLVPPTVIQPGGGRPAAALALVSPDVAFVVIDTGTETYVQRPAANMIAVPFPTPLAPDATLTARAYDADGHELGCTATNRVC
jgi:hypothetical protein